MGSKLRGRLLILLLITFGLWRLGTATPRLFWHGPKEDWQRFAWAYSTSQPKRLQNALWVPPSVLRLLETELEEGRALVVYLPTMPDALQTLQRRFKEYFFPQRVLGWSTSAQAEEGTADPEIYFVLDLNAQHDHLFSSHMTLRIQDGPMRLWSRRRN